MDQEFLQQLEKALSYVGTDKVWSRIVGGRELQFSPIPVPGQEKVNETLANPGLGPNTILESKRITLSYGIIGIDKINLAEYRDAGPIFPSVGRDGKPIKVTLDRYIYDKIKTWGGQFVDDVFQVYADLLESHQKENLKEIKFENAKDPEVELLELEARVSELRKMLGKPQLVDAVQQTKPEETETEETTTEPEGFDPFAKVPDGDTGEGASEPPPARSAPLPAAPLPGAAPVSSVAFREPSEVSRPARPILAAEELDLPKSSDTSPTSPHIPRQVEGDVIEERKERKPFTPPPIDKISPVSVNPRFSPTRR
jgi:hypothetical protein